MDWMLLVAALALFVGPAMAGALLAEALLKTGYRIWGERIEVAIGLACVAGGVLLVTALQAWRILP